jgi:hypothetical protein
MAKFLLLYNGGGMPETEAEQAAVMQAWGAWYTSLGSAIVDPGNPFSPQAKHIASDGTVGDTPAGSMASGYTIVNADSLDSAVAMAKACPILQNGGQVSVYETFEVM